MNFLAAIAGGATLLALVSGPSTSNSPIKVKSCEVAYISDGGDGSIMTQAIQFTNGVTLTVANPTSKAVSSFTVMGSYNDFHVTDTWAGTLPPGAQLSIFKHFAQLPYTDSKAQCKIVKVVYADGSTWPADDAATPTPAPAGT